MASTTVAFFGIRLEVGEDEIESLEERTHPAIKNSRSSGLQYYWGNFGSPGEQYLLLIGRLLGKFGPENEEFLAITIQQIQQCSSDVSQKLINAGFAENPSILIQFHPD